MDVRPFYCDDRLVTETDVDNDGYYNVTFTGDANPAADNDYCDQNKYSNDPGWTLPNNPCAPWHEVKRQEASLQLPACFRLCL